MIKNVADEFYLMHKMCHAMGFNLEEQSEDHLIYSKTVQKYVTQIRGHEVWRTTRPVYFEERKRVDCKTLEITDCGRIENGQNFDLEKVPVADGKFLSGEIS